MGQYCALCFKYISRSEDPVTGKDGKVYHAYCYSKIKDKLEKDYEKKGMFSRIKRSFRQPEAYLGEQIDRDDQRETARAEMSQEEIDSVVEYAKREFPGYAYLSDLLSDLESMEAIRADAENIEEICDALIREYPGIEDDREEHLSGGNNRTTPYKDREDFHSDDAIGFVDYDLDETRKGNNMRIKLSELKGLIKEGIEGKSFCVTGTLSMPRSEIWQMIEDGGGTVHKMVSGKTDYLVVGAGIGHRKIEKAQDLGVDVVTEKELLHMIRGGRPKTKDPEAWRGSGKQIGQFFDESTTIKESKYFRNINQVVDAWSDHFLGQGFGSEEQILDRLDSFIRTENRFGEETDLWDTSEQFRREVEKKILGLYEVGTGIKSDKKWFVMKRPHQQDSNKMAAVMSAQYKRGLKENKKMIKEYSGVGKFSSALDELLYAAVLEGWAGEEAGDVSEQGYHYDFIPLMGIESVRELELNLKEQFEQLSEEEKQMLEDAHGAIVEENDQGFVAVELFDSRKEAEEKWEEIVWGLTSEDDQEAETDDMYVDMDTPEDEDDKLVGEQKKIDWNKTTKEYGKAKKEIDKLSKDVGISPKRAKKAKEAMKLGGYEDVNDIPIIDSQVFDWKEIGEIKKWLKQWEHQHVYSVDTGADYYDLMVTTSPLDEDTIIRHNIEEVDAEWLDKLDADIPSVFDEEEDDDGEPFVSRRRGKNKELDEVKLRTGGDGTWSNEKKIVNCTYAVLDADDSKDFGELQVYFDTKDWNVHKDGLIYTDQRWISEFKSALIKKGFSKKAVSDISYSEQGMQGKDYISLDVDANFIKEFEKKNSGQDMVLEGAIGVGYGQASTCPCKECDEEDNEEDKKELKEDKSKYEYTSERQLRAAFWDTFDFTEEDKRDKPKIRQTWVDWLDSLQRDGLISDKLADSAVLKESKLLEIKKLNASWVINTEIDGYKEVIEQLLEKGIVSGWQEGEMNAFVFPGCDDANSAMIMATKWFKHYNGDNYFESIEELKQAIEKGREISLTDI